MVILGSQAFANGVQENRVAKAKELIAQKNYNDAILLLTQVVKEEPDRLDEAQDLLNEIRALRNEYNDAYEKVIALLYKDKDYIKAKEEIDKLKALDTNPNKANQELIRQATRTAGLYAANDEFTKLMNAAGVLLDQRQYAQAVALYLKDGYALARDLYDESNYGQVSTDIVDRTLVDLKGAGTSFVQQDQSLKTLQTQGNSIFKADYQTIEKNLPGLVDPIKNLSLLRIRLWKAALAFKAQNETFVKAKADTAFFLQFSWQVTLGRDGAAKPEGVVGALDRYLKETVETWTGEMRTNLDADFQRGRTDLELGKWDLAAAAFQSSRSLASSALTLEALWNQQGYVGADGSLNPEFLALFKTVLPLSQYFENRVVLADEGIAAANARQTAEARAADLTLSRQDIEAARLLVKGQKDTFQAFGTTVTQRINRELTLSNDGWSPLDGSDFLRGWQTLWSGLRQKTLANEIGFVDRRGKLDFDALSGRYLTVQASMNEIQGLVDGKTQTNQGVTILSKYPLEASRKLETEKPIQDQLRKDAQTFVDFYEGEDAEVKVGPVLAWPPKGRDLLSKIGQIQTHQVQLYNSAKEAYAQSVALRQQASDLIGQVKSATTAENFLAARNSWNQALARNSQALSLQEDPAFRKDSDDQMKKLMGDIQFGENQLVIREVRQLITQGSQSYLGGQFSLAYETLLRAQARWATTNPNTPNDEVEYWLSLANGALNSTSGRVLAETEPKFNEVQQLLNFARRDYEAAKVKYDEKNTVEAIPLLDSAKATLGKVLLVFPQNQDARVLNLLLQKSRSPTVFDTLISDYFKSALAKTKVIPNEALNDLLDLQSIQPDYPGLDNAIYQAKIAAKIIPAPIDPAKQKIARDLVTQAQRIRDANLLNQFPLGLRQVNEALRNDPNNTAAQTLKDYFESRTGTTAIIMSLSQKQEFERINALYLDGRNREAGNALNQFITDNNNLRNHPDVRRLAEQISAAN